jgi:hypothetical protein
MPSAMRTSAGGTWSERPRTIALAIVMGLLVSACGAAAASVAPTAVATPTPVPTASPNPHLSDPATADDVFAKLVHDGLVIVPHTASSGGQGHEPVKRIDAEYLGWPLAITQYTTARAAAEANGWADGSKPGQGDPSISLLGLNILVEWGPTTGASPAEPAGPQVDGARALRLSLDRLLSPLRARTVVPVPGPPPPPGASAVPSATPAASVSAPPSPRPPASAKP